MAQKQVSIKFLNSDKNPFFSVLRERTDAYFKDNNITKYGGSAIYVKSAILIAAYIVPFIFLIVFQPIFWVSLLLWFTMGVGIAGIGMSVMHDACHGAYSEKKWLNEYMGYTLSLAGAAVSNWKMQHNLLHHTYTNIVTHDEDIQSKGFLKFNPHGPIKHIVKFQHLYAFLFYGLLTLYWVVAKDMVQYFSFIKKGINKNSKAQNIKIFIQIILIKVCYTGLIIVLPIVLGIPIGEAIGGFLFMHFVAGIILTIIFQLAHTVEGTKYPLANNSGNIETDWAIHQMQTTVNFCPDNKWLSWYVGGLNYQVEHHLFPRISHIHYPALAPIVEATAKEYGVPYMVNHKFSDALKSHINLLKEFGNLPKLNEAIN